MFQGLELTREWNYACNASSRPAVFYTIIKVPDTEMEDKKIRSIFTILGLFKKKITTPTAPHFPRTQMYSTLTKYILTDTSSVPV
jgi:hypothetical protein